MPAIVFFLFLGIENMRTEMVCDTIICSKVIDTFRVSLVSYGAELVKTFIIGGFVLCRHASSPSPAANIVTCISVENNACDTVLQMATLKINV